MAHAVVGREDRRGRRHHRGGFTLVELLLAMSVAAFVLAGAMAASGLLTEAGARVAQGADRAVDVGRALRLFVREVRHAVTLVDSGDRLVLTMLDGSGVVWERTPSRHELHRVAAESPAAAEAAANALGLDVVSPGVRHNHGHLLDADYRASAVLQGVDDIDFHVVVKSSEAIAVRVRVDVTSDGEVHSRYALGLLLAKVAADAS
ncbi:MAG: prepilin-type N-terminal cleavage/methylation domain-containing protein [Planctomycetota bacterium]